MVFDRDGPSRMFLNLKLSFQGSERQPPSILSLALVFSAVMEEKNKTGTIGEGTTKQRLRLVIDSFHNQPGMLNRWKLDEERIRACLNILVGTTPESRMLIQGHLNYNKWSQSSFTSDLLRSTRWLIGASPRHTKDSMKSILTVTPEIQSKFLMNHIDTFNQQGKKVRLSARAKLRPSQSDWDKLVDYTCVMQSARDKAEEALKDHPTEKKEDVLQQIDDAFMARPVTKKKCCTVLFTN